MRKITTLLLAFALIFVSCEGDQGPPGFDGQDGQDGQDAVIGSTFERSINFSYNSTDNLHEALVAIPLAIEVFESDAILAYRFNGTVDINNQQVDTWEPLPQTFFLNNTDTLQYIFNHSFSDVELLINGNFDLSNLGTDFTQGQLFRFVVIPSNAINSVDTSDINAIMELGNIINVN